MKKFAKPMKIATVFIAIALIIPSLVGIYNFLINRETKTVLLKIDGEKIYKEDFDVKYSELAERIKTIETSIKESKNIKDEDYKALPEEIVKGYVLTSFIQEKLNDILSNNLGIKVSKKEVTDKYSEYETQLGGNKNLVLALQQQGFTVEAFREEIKSQLIDEKRLEEIKSKITITDEELMQTYDTLKYSTYVDKTFEESKEEIRETLLNNKATIYQSSMLENILDNAKFVYEDETIKPVVDKLLEVIYEDGEYKLKLINVISEYINSYVEMGLGANDEFNSKFKDLLKEDLSKQIRIKDAALKENIKLNEDLLPRFQLQYILNDYVSYLYKTYNPEESEMKAVFESNRSEFNIQNTVSGNIIGKTFTPTEEDFKNFEAKAKEIKESITKDNFEAKAKELSKDPGSATNGGNLGKADINNYVAEFRDAISKANVGDIIGPVKTQFGYHIIEILSKDETNPNMVDARHILIIPEATFGKKQAQKEVDEIKALIESGKLTWEEISANKTTKYSGFDIFDTFSKVTKDSAISILGYNKEFNDKLFSLKVNDFITQDSNTSYVLVQKTSEIPFKEVTFEEAKDKIKVILTNIYITKHLREI